jgi:putative DNA primase/helicase
MALHHLLGDAGFTLFDAWSSNGRTYKAEDAKSTWRSFKSGGKSGTITIATLLQMARNNGYGTQGNDQSYQLPSQLPKPDITAPDMVQMRGKAQALRDNGRPITEHPSTQNKAQREKLDRKHRQAARIAIRRWRAAAPATNHPYLKAKGVCSHGLRVEGFSLLVPLLSRRKICSLQTIAPNGDKRFLSGGRVSGCYFPVGTPVERIWLAEGYATAATVHEVTGDYVVCAFNAGNLVKVAGHIRERFIDHEIFIAADNDEAGVAAAMKAVNRHALEGAKWPDTMKYDWNDYCAAHGPDQTMKALLTGLTI